MGKKKKYAREFANTLVSFSPFRNADETPGAFKKKFGRERPGEHVWAAKPHKHRGRPPAQIEVFVRGLFAELISAVRSSAEPCGET
jgi:hypothetical protein